MPSNLYEAKNLGGHHKLIKPWKHHGLGTTIKAIVRPGKFQALQDVGHRIVQGKFAGLETQFRHELDAAFATIGTDAEASTRKMKQIFRTYYTKAFQMGQLASKGGLGTPTMALPAEDKRWLETFLRKEFEFWKKFLKDVKAKRGKMDYAKRKEMYIQALKAMYHSARVLSAPVTTLYYWQTHPAEHCSQCLYLSSKSPFTKENLPAIPAAGDTICKSNCQCHLQIRTVSAAKYLRVKRKAPTRQELLRGMRALKR
jgi:hypothetical protein